jgi:Spy/CpxP family protein refolding chaperone
LRAWVALTTTATTSAAAAAAATATSAARIWGRGGGLGCDDRWMMSHDVGVDARREQRWGGGQ